MRKPAKKRVVTTSEEEFARTFLAAAEGALSLADQAESAAAKKRCSQANQFALEMSEEIGALRGVMGSLSEEAAFEQDRSRKALLQKLLSDTEDDYQAVVSRRNDIIRSLEKSCKFSKKPNGDPYTGRQIPASAFSPNLPFYEEEDDE